MNLIVIIHKNCNKPFHYPIKESNLVFNIIRIHDYNKIIVNKCKNCQVIFSNSTKRPCHHIKANCQ